jgi:hypothetical protein
MRELGYFLESHGHLVRMLRSENPGKGPYEDDFQIVVCEWKKALAFSSQATAMLL